MALKEKIARAAIPIAFIFCLSPLVNSVGALVLGILIAVTIGNVFAARTKKLTRPMLSMAIVALGAGMNLLVVGRVGLHGLLLTLCGLSVTIGIGTLLGRLFKVEKGIALLVNVGTAICGGSAIAAVSAAVRSKEHETSVALGVVFTLNAIALALFPYLGHMLSLDQHQFGLWSAMAIHDTSSVVGATLQYGAQALEIGTTVKLARALWIVPVTIGVALVHKSENGEQKAKRQYPWFILGFLATSAIVTFNPALHDFGQIVENCGRHIFVATLFLIGLGISTKTLKQVGVRPFLLGVALWAIVAVMNLLLVLKLPNFI